MSRTTIDFVVPERAQWYASDAPVKPAPITTTSARSGNAWSGVLRHGCPASGFSSSSQMGVVGYVKRAAYCSSKAGVVNLTRVLCFEWAEYGIRVNAIGPTFVETPLTRPMFEDQAFKDDVLRRIPLGRLATPEEVAAAVVYLASPGAAMVNGHTLLIDGGWTAV